ncbi:hypothetical protein THAOC_23574 [Thalassiosira oceanica]|uniref:Uncharacterized protein n=1 Tax=Thalassiosira oceanica TaxID=159749 RepID=K0RRR5_THAOC|nr:hypothetical protein THAOC_23574 [Thalassiosira oceanica]|eukprot:EJK56523.1 hypothetical protein THAOC_23574 [Thalassiosira oceanica]
MMPRGRITCGGAAAKADQGPDDGDAAGSRRPEHVIKFLSGRPGKAVEGGAKTAEGTQGDSELAAAAQARPRMLLISLSPASRTAPARARSSVLTAVSPPPEDGAVRHQGPPAALAGTTVFILTRREDSRSPSRGRGHSESADRLDPGAVEEAATTAVVVVDPTGEAGRCAVHSITVETPYCVVECRSRNAVRAMKCRGDSVVPAIEFELSNVAGAPGIQSRYVLHHHPEAAVAGSLDPRRLDDTGDVAVGAEIPWSSSLLFREDTLDSSLGPGSVDQQQNLGQSRREMRTSLVTMCCVHPVRV